MDERQRLRWLEGYEVHCDAVGGCSSVGRAPALQAGGQRFDSAHLHQKGSQLRWLERTPDKREVGGSSPLVPTKYCAKRNMFVL